MFKNKKITKKQKILIISLVLVVSVVAIFSRFNEAKKTALRNEVTSKLDVQHQISKNLAGITETYSYKSFTSGVPTHVVYEDESYLGVPTGVQSDFLIIPNGVQVLQDLGYSKSALGSNYRTINDGKDVAFSSNAWDYVKNKETDKYTGYRLRGSELFIPFEGLDSRTTWEKNAPEFLGGKTAREKLDELQVSNSPEKVQSPKKELTPGGSASGDAYFEFNGVVGSDKQMHKLNENGDPVILNPNTNSWEPDTTPDAVIGQPNQKDSSNQNPNSGNMQASSGLNDQQVASDAYPVGGAPSPGPDSSLLSTATPQEAQQRYQEALDKYNKGELSVADFAVEKAIYRGSFIEPKTPELKKYEEDAGKSVNDIVDTFDKLYPERAKEIADAESSKPAASMEGNNPPSPKDPPSPGETWLDPPAPKEMATLDDAISRLSGSDTKFEEAMRSAFELSKNYDNLNDDQKKLVDSVNNLISSGKNGTEEELKRSHLNVLEPSLTGNKVREEMNAWNKLDEERTKAGFPDTVSTSPSNEFNGVVGSDKQMHKLDENGNPVILNPNTNSWEPDSTPDAVIDQSNQKEQTGQDKIDGFRNLDSEKQSELFDDVSKIRIGQTIAENQGLTKEAEDYYRTKSEAIAEKWGYDKNDFAKLDSDYSQAFSPKSDVAPPSDPQEKIEWFKNLDADKKNELFNDVSQIRIGQTIAENQGLTKETEDYYRTKSENAAEKWGYDKNDFTKLDSDYRSAFPSGNPVESETIGNNLEPFEGEAKWNIDPSKLDPPSPSAKEAYQTLNDFAQNGTDPRSWSEYLNPLGPSLQEKVNDLQKTAGLTPKVEQFGGIDLTKGDVSEPVKKLDDYFNNMQDPRSLSERINPFGPTVEEKINSLENQIHEEESQKKQILNGADFDYQDALQKYANGEISEEEKNKALEKLQEETDKYLKETTVISQPLSPETLPQNNFDFNSESSDRSEGNLKDVKTTGDRTGDKTGTSNFWERDKNQYSPESNTTDEYNNKPSETLTEPYDFKDNFVSGNGSPEYPFSDWTSENIAKAFSYDKTTGELKLNKDWKDQMDLPGGEYFINPPSKTEIIEGLYKENEIDLKTKETLEKKNKAGTLKEKISEEQDVYSAKENETIEGKPDSEKDREIKPGETLKTSQ